MTEPHTKSISYICDICNYKSKCIIDIENHNCSPVQQIDVQEEISQLKFLLYLEKFKNKMYINIIKRNTNIDIDDININDMEKNMVVCNYVKQNIPLVFHDCNSVSKIQPEEQSRGESKGEPRGEPRGEQTETKKHHRYRPIRSESKVRNNSEDENKTIESIPEKINNLRDEIETKVNIDDIQNQFTNIINNIENTKLPLKYIQELKNERLKLFTSLTIQDYSSLVLKHTSILEAIFKRKEYNDKKIKTTVMKAISPLEARLISYTNYHNTSIEVDEMDMLLSNISKRNIARDYLPFDFDTLNRNFSNYSCCLFTIDNLISNILFNKNGFNNYIFVEFKNEKKSDCFRFYYLEKISKGKRYWKMDCRLEILITNFTNIILPYMINLFRKLYKDTFQDNDYRSNYNTISQLTEIDCEQLFKNIFVVGHHKRFRNYLIDKMVEKAIYSPAENDVFNLTGDDSLLKKKIKSEEETDFGEIIKKIFDNISFIDVAELYNKKKISYA